MAPYHSLTGMTLSELVEKVMVFVLEIVLSLVSVIHPIDDLLKKPVTVLARVLRVLLDVI